MVNFLKSISEDCHLYFWATEDFKGPQCTEDEMYIVKWPSRWCSTPPPPDDTSPPPLYMYFPKETQIGALVSSCDSSLFLCA